MACLDTDLLVAFLRGQGDAVSFVESCKSRSERMTTTLYSAYELFKGAFRMGEAEVLVVQRLLASLEILYPSLSSAQIFGKEYARLVKAGKTPPEADLMIASVCISHGEELATRNTKDFNRIQGLKLKRW